MKQNSQKLDGSFGHFFLSVYPVHSCCGNHPCKCSVFFTVSSESPGPVHESPEVFLRNGRVISAIPLHQQLPNKLPTKSFYKIRRNSLSVAMNWRKTVPKTNPSSWLSLTLLVWGREIRVWMFWLEAWKFITSAIYCECNFLGVCCVLQTVPSWFCSKCIKKTPLCFVIVFTPASHHLKII